jgi:hypothetical protein
VRKIQGPLLVGGCLVAKRSTLPDAVLPPLAPQCQPGLPINPVYALMFQHFSTAAQQHVQAAVAEARLLPRQCDKPGAQVFI